MNGKLIAAGAAVVGVGAALGARAATIPVFERSSESAIDNRFRDWHEARGKAEPGTKMSFPWRTAGEEYGEVFVPTVGSFGALGLLGLGGAALLGKNAGAMSATKTALAAGALIGGLALAGVVVGSATGQGRGSSEAKERNGLAIDTQIGSVMRHFDANSSGGLEIDDSAGRWPEYLRKFNGDVDSIEHAAKKADTDGDAVTTSDELRAHIGAFDANNDGILNSVEAGKLSDSGNESTIFTVV